VPLIVGDRGGLVRLDSIDGDSFYYRITPGIRDGTEAPTDNPVMAIDRDASFSDGYLTIRNFGQRPGRILAVELAAGDLVWDDVDRDSCTGAVLSPATASCALRVTGSQGTLRFFLDGDAPQEVDVVLGDLPDSSPVPTAGPARIITTTVSAGAGEMA